MYFADMCAKEFCSCLWGPSGGSSVRRLGSDDPQRREQIVVNQKFLNVLDALIPCANIMNLICSNK